MKDINFEEVTDLAKELLQEHFHIFDFMETNYDRFCPIEFYKFIFPDSQKSGEINKDYSKPNPIYIYRDRETDKVKRRIMLKDTWEEDYIENIELNKWAICGGLSYSGKKNTLQMATTANALIIDLDSVGYNEFKNFIERTKLKPEQLRSIPKPTFLATSGTGIHIYYVFDEPVELFPYTKEQLNKLKRSLTFRIWDYKGTTRLKTVQYQSINQGFRMVGSINGKYGEIAEIKAYKVGQKVSLSYLNQYVDENCRVDLTKKYRKGNIPLKEAKKKYPEWYKSKYDENGIIKPNANNTETGAKWNIKRDLYDWWLSQIDKITGGHRYFYMLCTSVYANKCNISFRELEEDMQKIFNQLKDVPHTNFLTEKDLEDALKVYGQPTHKYTIDYISKITGVYIEKNKRNYRNQEQHIRIMNAIRDTLYPNGEWRNLNGRPKGSGTKEQLVLDYIEENPDHNPTQIAKNLGISRTTVYKYIKK